MLIEAGFLSERELIEMVNLIRKYSGRAPQLDWDVNDCGSYTAALSKLGSRVVAEIEERINKRLGLAGGFGEGLIGVKYEPGQRYRLHHDCTTQDNEQWDACGMTRGNRTWTAMVYCNTLSGGGATVFPELGVRVEPRGGMLIAWDNRNPDGSPDMDLLHCAEPHRVAEKYIVIQWFREREA